MFAHVDPPFVERCSVIGRLFSGGCGGAPYLAVAVIVTVFPTLGFAGDVEKSITGNASGIAALLAPDPGYRLKRPCAVSPTR